MRTGSTSEFGILVIRLTYCDDISKARMAKLLGFGTYHVDRPNKVQDELGEIAEEADVILVESPRIQEGDDNKLDLLIQNPMMLIAGAFLSFCTCLARTDFAAIS